MQAEAPLRTTCLRSCVLPRIMHAHRCLIASVKASTQSRTHGHDAAKKKKRTPYSKADLIDDDLVKYVRPYISASGHR